MSRTSSQPPPLPLREAERLVADALHAGRLERDAAARLAARLEDPRLRQAVLDAAFESKRRGKGDALSVSRNVFVPLTNLCRDRCAYCTFAKPPDSPEARTWALEEVAEISRRALALGCSEALMCLGDKPERAYRSHRQWLAERGLSSTAEYLVEACRVAFEAGLLPHTNAGVLSADEMRALRPWNASMGLMLESSSRRLRRRGMAHYYAPDKEPALRMRMHEEAGEIGIPFTSGILLGIGETSDERVDTLLAIRDLADRGGHIQETIVQPFHAKPGTPMAGAPELGAEEFAGWVGLARLVLGPHMNLQVPPNLAPGALELLARSGANDWGGVSPLSIDYINPEAPWPAFAELARRSEASGQRLVERLPVYPEHLIERPDLFDPRVRAALLRRADASGWARPGPATPRVEAA